MCDAVVLVDGDLVDDVDHALELLVVLPGQLDGGDAVTPGLAELGEALGIAGTVEVELVQEDQAWHAHGLAQLPELVVLGLQPRGRVDDEHGQVGGAHRRPCVPQGLRTTRGVQHRDGVVGEGEGRDGQGQRVAAVLFLRFAVDRRAAGHGAGDDAGRAEHGLGQCRGAGSRVAQQDDVADLCCGDHRHGTSPHPVSGRYAGAGRRGRGRWARSGRDHRPVGVRTCGWLAGRRTTRRSERCRPTWPSSAGSTSAGTR